MEYLGVRHAHDNNNNNNNNNNFSIIKIILKANYKILIFIINF